MLSKRRLLNRGLPLSLPQSSRRKDSAGSPARKMDTRHGVGAELQKDVSWGEQDVWLTRGRDVPK